jgi:transcriptional regulator with XRE-family HTH domain
MRHNKCAKLRDTRAIAVPAAPHVYHGSSDLIYPAHMTLNKQIGQRLKSARQAQSFSLSELAGRTKTLSKSRISNYEQGIRRMGIEEAQELSEALDGVTPAYLLCLDDASPLSSDEWQLIQRYRRTDERGRFLIQQVADTEARYEVSATDEPDEST